ncbi:ABC transporter ATP-binding protein [uncultured Rothia sp.]|uniref:ABC transporter ATP-binding protein n=1 Tax=uncultured Rothia sp. TaxID=316088 RepID=UPI003217E97F
MSLIHTSHLPVPPPTVVDQPQNLTLWQYMKPIRAKWLTGVAVAICASVIGISIPQVLAWIVDHLVANENPSGSTVWAGGLLMIGLGLLQAGLIFVRRMLVIDQASTVEMSMRMSLFDHLMRMPAAFHDHWPSGQLLTRSTSDLSLMRRWIAFGSIQSISSTVMLAAGLFYLFRGSWLLGLIYLCSVPFMLLTLWLFVRTMKSLTRSVQQQSGDLATSVEESVQGIRVLKALGQGQNSLSRFTAQASTLMNTEIARSQAVGSMLVKTISITAVTMAISLFVGIHQVAQEKLSLGELTAYFATTAVLTPQIQRAGMLISMWLDSKVAMERHREIMQEPVGEDVLLVSGVTTPQVSRHDAAGVKFEHVSFTFGRGKKEVLHELTLDVAPGEILALVGSTGSGKSTVLQLIPRLYAPTRGKVLLDNTDISTIPLPELRAQMAIAFEEPVLFSSSVRENVLMGVETERFNSEELESIVATALRVSASDFVDTLPDGVETLIGEEGMSLSGGQRQRLSLARAIACDPRVLLLDDPLSALDVNTEEAVVGMLKEQLKNTTTIITAHRPSTVALADRVALLDKGRIAAIGTHSELMKNPAYARLMLLNPDDSTAKNHTSQNQEVL